MRKVPPQMEIPVAEISHEAIQERLNAYKARKIDRSIIQKFGEFQDEMTQLIGTGKVDAVYIVRRIYEIADYYMEHDTNKYLVCRKGCAHCCRVPVDVTALEANIIEQVHGYTPAELRTWQPRPTRVDYCPFLNQKKGVCKIYDVRPLACRTFGAFDSPVSCESPDNRHYIHSGNLQPFLGTCIDNMRNWSREAGYIDIADIRQWFPSLKKKRGR